MGGGREHYLDQPVAQELFKLRGEVRDLKAEAHELRAHIRRLENALQVAGRLGDGFFSVRWADSMEDSPRGVG